MTTNRTSSVALSLLLVAGSAACETADEPDAYGRFEAREVAVSSEVGGPLLRFDVREGQRLAADAVVGRVDTVDLSLQRRELQSRTRSARARVEEVRARMASLEAELGTAREEHDRTVRLLRDDAATAERESRTRGRVRALEEQVRAARSQAEAAREEAAALEARAEQVEERIRRSHVRNPTAGTVLATYAEPGELVQAGAPLYRIAPLDTLLLRAYVDGAQLTRVRIGRTVRVQYDVGPDARRSVDGLVRRVAPEAEFTPTPIQTRDERTDLVYAVEIAVPNPEGALKIGMPGELFLSDGTEGGAGDAEGPEAGP